MFKTTKSKVIFVLIFSVICILITICLVLYKNIEIEDSNTDIVKEATNDKEKDFMGIEKNGKYDENDIAITFREGKVGKVSYRYCQISGLKDKTIQDRINKEIEQLALNCYKEEINDLDIVSAIYVDVTNRANFANVLSFSCNYYAEKINNNSQSYDKYFGLNYDLTTGNKITLDKLFTSDAPIENILNKYAYKNLLQPERNLSGYLVINDYGDIEEEVLEVINAYKQGKLTEFCFNPYYINVFYKDNTIRINMEENAEYIAIYNRYTSASNLYENNNVGLKKLYNLTKRDRSSLYYSNYQNEGNYFIDISIVNNCEDEYANKLLDEKIKEIEQEIEKIKKLATDNKFFVVNYWIEVYLERSSDNTNLIAYYENGNVYEMSVHDFEENVEPIIIDYNLDATKNEDIFNYIYDFEEVLKIAPQSDVEYYNPITGDKIVI